MSTGVTDYRTALDHVTARAKELGYDGVSPESLTAIKEDADQWGWPHGPLRGAYNVTMAGFRALLPLSTKENSHEAYHRDRPAHGA